MNSNETIAAMENGKAQLGARLASALHTAKDKVEESLSRVGEMAAEAGEQIANRSASLKHSAGVAIDQARDKLVEGKDASVELAADLLDHARSAASRIGHYIKANPGKSFAAAALLGWLAARQIRKSGRRPQH
jgi:ElaB/YqjD/DUF883 family membrane-anchored ribosome-binding protein